MLELSLFCISGNDDLKEDLSDESEDEVVGFYEDSDSDMSDSLMKSQELDLGFAANPDTDTCNSNSVTDNSISSKHVQIKQDSSSEFLPSVFGGTDQSKIWADLNKNDNLATFSSELFQSKIWADLNKNDNLATFSSELFSTSVPFLSVNLKQQTDGFDNDVIQGKKQVSVPPGFHSSSEAKHVAEISQKLANFVIETDTEASVTATELGKIEFRNYCF